MYNFPMLWRHDTAFENFDFLPAMINLQTFRIMEKVLENSDRILQLHHLNANKQKK